MKSKQHLKIINAWNLAWNHADPEAVVSFYADDFEYRDSFSLSGIQGKEHLLKYLTKCFESFPYQNWTGEKIMRHRRPGFYSVCYKIEFGRSQNAPIKGYGMDILGFDQEKKIFKDWIYMNFDEMSYMNFPQWGAELLQRAGGPGLGDPSLSGK